MAMVYVGSARSDENGKAYGGKAGDQKNGLEVSTQAWYKHSKGWRVFRANAPEHAAKIAETMRWACENNLIGYDQWERNSLYDELAKNAFQSMNLSKAVETDCSALVRVCLAFCGIDVPSDFRTANMASHLLKTGMLTELKGSKYTDQSVYLGAGDILVTQTSGHTVVVLNNGDKYEGENVAEKQFETDTLRKGDAGEGVKVLQGYLLSLGYSMGKYGCDGDFGSATESAVKAFQRDQGLDVDGICGAKTREALLAAIDAANETPKIDPAQAFDLSVKSGTWRVRTGPGTAYETAGYVQGGEKLTKIDLGDWVPVLYGGEICFISQNAVEGA